MKHMKAILPTTFALLAALLALLACSTLHPSQAAADGAPPQMDDNRPYQVYLPALYRASCTGFTAPIVNRTGTFPISSLAGYFDAPNNCATGLPAEKPIATNGYIRENPVPTGRQVWVFVYASNGRYYPQCKNALTGVCGVDQTEDSWNTITYLGRAGKKEHFHLVLVDINQAGHEDLIEKMIEWAKKNSFPGLSPSELAGYDVKELSSIQVETAGQ